MRFRVLVHSSRIAGACSVGMQPPARWPPRRRPAGPPGVDARRARAQKGKAAAASAAGVGRGPTGVIKSVLDTSRAGGKARDEIFVDIVEKVSCTFSSSGYVQTSQIDGAIQARRPNPTLHPPAPTAPRSCSSSPCCGPCCAARRTPCVQPWLPRSAPSCELHSALPCRRPCTRRARRYAGRQGARVCLPGRAGSPAPA